MNKIKEHFPLPLHVKFINGEVWELLEPFEYITKKDETIHVPAKFLTDMASIPRIFQPIIGDPTGRYGPSAIIHDWLYHVKKFSRRKSDAIFLEAMIILGVSWWKRNTMYTFVRMFSWLFWNNRKPLIPIVLLFLCLSSISCASLKVAYDEEGRIIDVWSTGIQDTETTQEKEGVKTIVKRKAAFEIWPENLFTIYKD